MRVERMAAEESPAVMGAAKKKLSNFRRKRTDYIWIAGFFAALYWASETFFPGRSTPADRQYISETCNPFGFTSPVAQWTVWLGVTIMSIGITNFAFDHVVEIWVTMSSTFVGYVLFPSNFYVGKAIGLGYMVLVHWDGFYGSRFHINHHYLITKNYGSHFPFLDMFFGTYQWETYNHPESTAYGFPDFFLFEDGSFLVMHL